MSAGIAFHESFSTECSVPTNPRKFPAKWYNQVVQHTGHFDTASRFSVGVNLLQSIFVLLL